MARNSSKRPNCESQLEHILQLHKSYLGDLMYEFLIAMNICRNYASAGSNATRPVLFEPMVLSILLDQQKTLNRLKKDLLAASKQSISS